MEATRLIFAKRADDEPDRDPPPITHASPETVRSLRNLGYSARQIAHACGWTLDRVTQVLAEG